MQQNNSIPEYITVSLNKNKIIISEKYFFLHYQYVN